MLGRKSPRMASPRSRTTPIPRSPSSPSAPQEKANGHIKKITQREQSPREDPVRRQLAAAYARVSTDRQEQQESIGSQIETLQHAAAERGYELPAEFMFIDDGYSGAPP